MCLTFFRVGLIRENPPLLDSPRMRSGHAHFRHSEGRVSLPAIFQDVRDFRKSASGGVGVVQMSTSSAVCPTLSNFRPPFSVVRRWHRPNINIQGGMRSRLLVCSRGLPWCVLSAQPAARRILFSLSNSATVETWTFILKKKDRIG